MKYDIILHRHEGGITQAEVPWALEVNHENVIDRVGKLMWFKLKDPERWKGDVVIRESPPDRKDRTPLHA